MTIQDNSNQLQNNSLVTTAETLILASNFFAITPQQVGATGNAAINAAMATFWYRIAPAGGIQQSNP